MFKILTLNVNYYGTKHGPWPSRRSIIQEALAAADPDFIALQAVRQDPALENGLDQASQLARLFPAYQSVFFEPAATGPDGAAEGSAILSKSHLIEQAAARLALLPGLDDTNQRVLLGAKVNLPTGPLHIYNGHFSWVGDQALRNIEETLAYIQSNRPDEPAVLVGDFNTPPESELLDRFRQAGWLDVWAEKCPEHEGYTFVEDGRLAKRIDYAWIRHIPLAQVESVDIIADGTDAEGNRASDHAGLLLTLAR